MSFVLFGINTARSCHLSVLRMNQTDKLATKCVFGVITFLITDYLFSCRFNNFPSSYRFVLMQELKAFSYWKQVYCASMVYSDQSAS